MTTRTRTDPRKNFVPRYLPWLLAVAAFAVYWLTLNRWVSLFNLNSVARISGWTWQPEVTSPILFLVTYPFRWLPPVQIPVALNLFAAGCAALTLGLLARSVALLPHDRTDAQRTRERSDFSFLTLHSAWLPPVLAVLVCGLQMTFWENATNYTEEMFDLLLFAFVIWSLLEYRLDEREGRLFLASFVYGASLANNWGMIGYVPLFVTAIVWIRGLSFFNLRFLKRMMLCGLLGMVLYFLLPLLVVISGRVPMTFWEALKVNLGPQYVVLKLYFYCVFHPQTYYQLEAVLLAYLIPLCAMAIRWKSSFGDHSQIGSVLTIFLFHLACAGCLVLCIWMAFDPPFSPRRLALGPAFLTLYYLGALSIGYFSGYLLLVFGKAPKSRVPSPVPPQLGFLNPLMVAGVWGLAAVTVAGLIYRNTPQVQAVNNRTLQQYASFTVENLPRSGAVLLSDDPQRLFLVQAALTKDGRAKDFLPLDTHSLYWPAYLRFLHSKFPRLWPAMAPAKDTNVVNPLVLVNVLNLLAKTNELYYLHPSFGYYFEQFYPEPHGPVYKLKLLPTDTFLPPLPDQNQIARNEAFWSQAKMQAFAPIAQAVAPPDPNAPLSGGDRWLKKFHVPREQNPAAITAGIWYSRSLNFWGVQLQRAGDLTNAAAAFALATELNPDNVVAQINLQFNQELAAGKSVPVDLSRATTDQFGKYHDWNDVQNANGPFDEPSFCFKNGQILVQSSFLRQAIAQFSRVRELQPDNLPARLWLGQIYLVSHLPDRTLEVLQDPVEQPQKFSLVKTNKTQLNLVLAAAYFQKDDLARGTRLLETEIALHPTDDDLFNSAAQVFLSHGLYTNALALIDYKLRLAPEDPTWLFSRGYIFMQMKSYDAAVTEFSHVLALQATNSPALFYRALAYFDSDKLDAARADYVALQHSITNSPEIAYRLGEIAWRKHETNDAIKNYEVYLANADTNTEEATNVIQRLRELKGHSP